MKVEGLQNWLKCVTGDCTSKADQCFLK